MYYPIHTSFFKCIFSAKKWSRGFEVCRFFRLISFVLILLSRGVVMISAGPHEYITRIMTNSVPYLYWKTYYSCYITLHIQRPYPKKGKKNQSPYARNLTLNFFFVLLYSPTDVCLEATLTGNCFHICASTDFTRQSAHERSSADPRKTTELNFQERANAVGWLSSVYMA